MKTLNRLTARPSFVALLTLALPTVLAALLAVASLALSTPAALAAPAAAIVGAGKTGVQVQNLDPKLPTDIVAEFYQPDGTLAHSEVRPAVPPGASANFYLPGIAGLSNGAYAMIITADRPIAAINRTDWDSGAAAIYGDVTPDGDVALPLLVSRFAGQTSLVALQNTDVRSANDLRVEVSRSGAGSPEFTQGYSLAPAASMSLDVGKDPNFLSLSAPFLGSMRVKGTAPVGLATFVDVEASRMAVSAFEGVPAGQATDRLFAPLVRHEWFGTTGISVVNPGTDSVEVRVSYRGAEVEGNACRGQVIAHDGPVSIPAGSSAVFYQGGPTPETGAPNLPPRCVGAALIEAAEGGRVLAIVNDFTADEAGVPLTAAAYNAVSDARGATRVAVPLFRSRHTAAELSSGIQLMSLDADEPTRATITFFDESGAPIPGGADREAVVAPLGAHTWFAPSLSGIAERSAVYGSAIVESDRPVALIVSESSLTGATDTVTYNAVPLPEAEGQEAEGGTFDVEIAGDRARTRITMSVGFGAR